MGSNDQKGEDNQQVKKEILIVLCFSISQRQFYRSATGLILDNVAPLSTDIQSWICQYVPACRVLQDSISPFGDTRYACPLFNTPLK